MLKNKRSDYTCIEDAEKTCIKNVLCVWNKKNIDIVSI